MAEVDHSEKEKEPIIIKAHMKDEAKSREKNDLNGVVDGFSGFRPEEIKKSAGGNDKVDPEQEQNEPDEEIGNDEKGKDKNPTNSKDKAGKDEEASDEEVEDEKCIECCKKKDDDMISCDCCEKWTCLVCSNLKKAKMKQISKNTLDIEGSKWFCRSCLQFINNSINDVQPKKSDNEDEGDEEVFSESQIQEIKRKFLEMKNRYSMESNEKLEQRDKQINDLTNENIKLAKTLADTLKDYYILEENWRNETNAKEEAHLNIVAMEEEFNRLREQIDEESNLEDGIKRKGSSDKNKENRDKINENQTLTDTIFILEEKIFQMRLEAKDKKMLARVQALRLKMKNIENKIGDEEDKSIEMNEKFKNCTDLIKNLERQLEEYKTKESQAVNRLGVIMKEIESIDAEGKIKNSHHDKNSKQKDFDRDLEGDLDKDECNEPEHLRKIFVRNLNFKTTEERLKSYFDQFGKVSETVIMKEAKTQRSRGFGFVTFSNSEAIDKVQEWRPHEIDGREIDTKRAIPREVNDKPSEKMQVEKIFIRGIKEEMNDELIIKAFEKYGKVVNIHIPKVQGKCKEFGFVSFEDFDIVDKLCLFKEILIDGHKISITKAIESQKRLDRNIGRDTNMNYRESFRYPRSNPLKNDSDRYFEKWSGQRENYLSGHNTNAPLYYQRSQHRGIYNSWNGNQEERTYNRSKQENSFNICRYNLEGRCKFGENCRRSHQIINSRQHNYQANRAQNNSDHFLGIEAKINQEVKRQLRNFLSN